MKGKEEKMGGGVDGWEQVAATSRGRIVGGGTRSLLSHGRADADRATVEENGAFLENL